MKRSLILPLAALVLFASCGVNPVKKAVDAAIGKASDAVAAKGGELLLEKLASKDGQKVDIKMDSEGNIQGISLNDGKTSFDTGGRLKWPDSMPSSVPVFDGGNILSVGNEEHQISVMFTGIDKPEPAKAYAAKAMAKGWEKSEDFEAENMYNFQGKQGDQELQVTYVEGMMTVILRK